MEKEVYEATYQLENTHWYFVSLRELISGIVSQISNQRGRLDILDAGCGTGGLTKNLNRYGRTVGIDISEEAIRHCKSRNLPCFLKASVTQLPFLDESFDVVTSTDVLYHRQVDNDEEAVREFRRVLKKDGILILNLPAYEFLRSPHDIAVHTKRRYTRKEIEKKLQREGFDIQKLSHRNSFLFPLILLIRVFRKKTHSENSDIVALPQGLNQFLMGILRLENKILKMTNLPFGSSVFCVARKENS